MQEFKRVTLKNGMRLILVPRKQDLATMVAVLVEAGSKYEVKKNNGISHFLEHMCFKGTTKRPMAMDIAKDLDSLGAQYNAFTSHEYTSYYVKARNEVFNETLEIIADLYLNPTLDAKEIEKEKGVIEGEINMYEDMPHRKVWDVFMELLYGDQPAGWNIAGPKETVKTFNREDFVSYRSNHYLAQATSLVIAGGFNEKDVIKKVTGHFSKLERGTKGTKKKVKDSQMRPAEKLFEKKSDQTHLVMGFRAFDTYDKRKYALQVLSDILGGGMSSRLWQVIREDMGAAYYVNASPDFYTDHGMIAMSAGVHHEKTRDVIKAGLKEFAKMRDELVSPKELIRAKDHLIGNFYLSLETSDQIGYFYGGQEVMNMKLRDPKKIAAEIKAISANDIRSISRQLFKEKTLNFAAVGPFHKATFGDILKL
ncbi:MAG: pitrilysin family protein [bacterium]|nr:pitrilysin family protein [Candidatus Jorgensenbacteria bacterium]